MSSAPIELILGVVRAQQTTPLADRAPLNARGFLSQQVSHSVLSLLTDAGTSLRSHGPPFKPIQYMSLRSSHRTCMSLVSRSSHYQCEKIIILSTLELELVESVALGETPRGLEVFAQVVDLLDSLEDGGVDGLGSA